MRSGCLGNHASKLGDHNASANWLALSSNLNSALLVVSMQQEDHLYTKAITCPQEGLTLPGEVGGGVALGCKTQKLLPEERWVPCPGDSLRVGVLLLAIGLCLTRTLSCRLCRRRREIWSQLLSPDSKASAQLPGYKILKQGFLSLWHLLCPHSLHQCLARGMCWCVCLAYQLVYLHAEWTSDPIPHLQSSFPPTVILRIK